MAFGAMARLVGVCCFSILRPALRTLCLTVVFLTDDQREHLQEVLSRGCILCFRTYQGGWKSVIKVRGAFLRPMNAGCQLIVPRVAGFFAS